MQAPGASGTMQVAPQAQITAPTHVPPPPMNPQSESRQHWPIVGAATQRPATDGVAAQSLPRQRMEPPPPHSELRQQQPVGGAVVGHIGGGGGGTQAPVVSTEMPFTLAMHAALYVFPSQPQTGMIVMPVQSVVVGRVMHVPAAAHMPVGC